MAFVTEEKAYEMYCVKSSGGLCKGSSCMAWRWKPKETRYVKEGNKIPDGWILMPDEFGDDLIESTKEGKKYYYYEKIEKEKTGFCGIGGYITTHD